MTKILALSDIHNKIRHSNELVKRSEEVDLVIGAGDFGNFRQGLDRTFEILKNIKKPFVVVPGNHESLEELQEVCKELENVHVLHASGTEIDGKYIYGIGGGIPVTPFGDWSYDFTEEQATEMLADLPEKSILISHSPPKGTLDKNRIAESLGSTSIRDAIITKKPVLCICGHIHECAGRSEMLEETQVVNAGPGGMILEI